MSRRNPSNVATSQYPDNKNPFLSSTSTNPFDARARSPSPVSSSASQHRSTTAGHRNRSPEEYQKSCHRHEQGSSSATSRDHHVREHRSGSTSSRDRHSRNHHSQDHHSQDQYRSRRSTSFESEGDGYYDEDQTSAEDYLSQAKNRRKETLNVAQDSLRRLRETEELGVQSMEKLSVQSELLHSAQTDLHKTRANEANANEQVTELKRLNKLFGFKNPFRSRTKEKRLAMEKAEQAELERIAQQEQTSKGLSESKRRMERLRLENRVDNKAYGSAIINSDLLDEEDRADEREIDNALSDMSSILGNLKRMGASMGDEVQHQNRLIERISKQSDDVNAGLKRTNVRMGQFK